MQDEVKSISGAPAPVNVAVRWRRFDRTVQAIKTVHAGVPTQALQATIDEACSAVRQEMGLAAVGRRETP